MKTFEEQTNKLNHSKTHRITVVTCNECLNLGLSFMAIELGCDYAITLLNQGHDFANSVKAGVKLAQQHHQQLNFNNNNNRAYQSSASNH